jgi:hypothetical protein
LAGYGFGDNKIKHVDKNEIDNFIPSKNQKVFALFYFDKTALTTSSPFCNG